MCLGKVSLNVVFYHCIFLNEGIGVFTQLVGFTNVDQICLPLPHFPSGRVPPMTLPFGVHPEIPMHTYSKSSTTSTCFLGCQEDCAHRAPLYLSPTCTLSYTARRLTIE